VRSLIRNVGIHRQTFDLPLRQHKLHHHPAHCRRLATIALVMYAVTLLKVSGSAQTSLPFEVSNPKHLDWSTDEANRIYSSACELVARSIRPDKPPRLQPKFVLVLGTAADETVRNGTLSEVHLRKWNPEHFAEAMVVMATREIIKGEDLIHLTRDTLIAAQATVSVNELRRKK